MPRGKPVPCPHADELPPRRVVCDACRVKRRRESNEVWREQNREYLRQYRREFRERPGERERELERNRLYAQRHPERVKAQVHRWYEQNREQHAANVARWKAEHPELMRQYRKNWYERTKADPVAWARYLESNRMKQRLARERAGDPMPPVPVERYPQASSQWVMDAEPLRALVRASAGSLNELAAAAGVSAKLLYRLLHEDGKVTVAAADRLVVALGLHIDLIAEGAGVEATA